VKREESLAKRGKSFAGRVDVPPQWVVVIYKSRACPSSTFGGEFRPAGFPDFGWQNADGETRLGLTGICGQDFSLAVRQVDKLDKTDKISFACQWSRFHLEVFPSIPFFGEGSRAGRAGLCSKIR